MPRRIRGVVFNADWSAPLPNVTVYAFSGAGTTEGSSVTNSNGYFEILGLSDRNWVAKLASGTTGNAVLMPPDALAPSGTAAASAKALDHRGIEGVDPNQHHDEDHLARHHVGGSDALSLDLIAGTIDASGHGDQGTGLTALHSLIADEDNDTKIQLEEAADEDKVRVDTGGVERVVIDSSGLDVTGNITVSGTVDGVDIADRDHAESHTIDSHPDTTLVVGEYARITADGLESEPAGTADRNLVRIDHEEGAEEGDFPRFTEDGVVPLKATEFLEALSSVADDPFDWNDQELRNVRKLFIKGNRVEARWSHAITVENPAAGDNIPIFPFYDGRVTITDIKDGTIGSSTTADYTDVFASDVQATTTDADRTDFQSPQSDPAGGWLVCAISAVSGTAPDFLAIGLRGTYAP
ncbi:MAG: peptidase associated/transthyretin-like domain-containing protein [Planctomycetota bacterium]|jgi:hypothetical protein